MLEKIVEILGGSPIQYRYLLNAEKLVEKRAMQGTLKLGNLSLGMTCGFCFIMSALAATIPFLLSTEISTFTFALLNITMSMFMVGLWTLPYFDILLNPINYSVVAHTPVSSRTYFLVKLTQVLTYTAMLLVSLNPLPAICGIWIRVGETSQLQFLFPFVYLPVAFISGFFAIGTMTAFAGYLTKLYTKKGFRNIAQYAQFVLPALFPSLIYLLPSDPTIYKSVMKWLYALPNGWFAGVVSLALGGPERPEMMRDLILTGLAVVSVLLLIVIPLRSIAKGYSKYLTYLLESGNRQKAKLRVKPSLLARFCRSRTTYAGFCLCAAYMRRDKYILNGLISALGGLVMLVVLFIQDRFSMQWFDYSPTTGMSPTFTTCFSLLGISFVSALLIRVRHSEHYKASWMLSLAPLEVPSQLWRGVLLTSFLYIVTPYTLLLFCVASVLWGAMALFYILPGLIILLYYAVLFPKPQSGTPLSLEVVQKSRNFDWLSFVFGLLACGILVGIQLLAFWLNIWVYIAVYCLIVIGGFIGFLYLFREK